MRRILGAVVVVALVALAILLVMTGGEQGSGLPRADVSPAATRTASAGSPGRTATGTTHASAEPSPTVRGGRTPTVVPAPVRPAAGEQAQVVRVVDGDTIDVRRADGSIARVRYIGVNTPETVDPRRPVECFGKEASARNTELVGGKTVLLEKDLSETDQYDRLLRYVWVGDMLVNAALVSEGFARPVTYPPDVRYADWYFVQEREARAAGRGLWGACRP